MGDRSRVAFGWETNWKGRARRFQPLRDFSPLSGLLDDSDDHFSRTHAPRLLPLTCLRGLILNLVRASGCRLKGHKDVGHRYVPLFTPPNPPVLTIWLPMSSQSRNFSRSSSQPSSPAFRCLKSFETRPRSANSSSSYSHSTSSTPSQPPSSKSSASRPFMTSCPCRVTRARPRSVRAGRHLRDGTTRIGEGERRALRTCLELGGSRMIRSTTMSEDGLTTGAS